MTSQTQDPSKYAVLVAIFSLWILAPVVVADSVVVFNEIHYHPPTNEFLLEWIELQNQHTVDVDVSGWSLEGGIHYLFPEGTVIPGGGFLVVAASPRALQDLDRSVLALGPFGGSTG